MKKISLVTKYSEIEDLFWEAGILQRCGFYDFCPIFEFYRDNKWFLYDLTIKKDGEWCKTFYFLIDIFTKYPDIDGDFSDESPSETKNVYQSKDYDCSESGRAEAMKDLKAWIKEKMGELNG